MEITDELRVFIQLLISTGTITSLVSTQAAIRRGLFDEELRGWSWQGEEWLESIFRGSQGTAAFASTLIP
jgi:hypothetical protein